MVSVEAMAPETTTSPPVRIEERAGYGVGTGVLGLIALAVLLPLSSQPLEDLVFGLIFTPIFGVLMWLMSRKEARRGRSPVGRLSGAAARTPFVGGLVQAAVVGVLLSLFVLLLLWLLSPSEGAYVSIPAILFGTSLWMGLEIRDCRSGPGR